MRRIFFLVIMLLPLTITAQLRFGYFNYSEILHNLPDYKKVKADYDDLLTRCDKEIERSEQELTRNYVSFLNGQHEFPEPILRKRQKELQDLVDKSIIFRDQVKEWLTQAYDSLFYPLNAIIDDAVARVCVHNNLAYAIDLERAGFAFVNPANGFDITNAVLGTITKMGEPQQVNATDGVRPKDADNAATETEKEAINGEVVDKKEEIEEKTTLDEVSEGALH